MRRRDFLRATLVTAGSVVVPTACSDTSTDSGECSVHESGTYFPQSVASGDPKPDSVVLWTRVAGGNAQQDLSLSLIIALDEEFTQLVELTASSSAVLAAGEGSTRIVLTALAAFDHCVKVKVTGLSPGTTYFYQFYYATPEGCYSSPKGRTRTAPAPDADVPVRFAFVSCQDFIGRYYNAYALMAKEELDFVVHLGDYIYETTGDPSFQAEAGGRAIAFTDAGGAITLTSEDGTSYAAARSLSNYRELYKAYRSDPALQRVHARFPMIAVWDDHEFSNDCYGATANYLTGEEEEDVDRRKAANQAWFEYMPVDYPAGDDFRYDPAVEYPKDIAIHRDFVFGAHVHLVMTDLRTYRADHLISEDAFPGEVIITSSDLGTAIGAEPSSVSFFISTPDFADGTYEGALKKAAPLEGFDPSLATGRINVNFINMVVERLNAAMPDETPVKLIETADLAGQDTGLSYMDLGKTGYRSAFGSRYLVDKDGFDAYSKLLAGTDPDAGVVMGAEQEQWFLKTLGESKSTWKIWGNSYTLSQLAIDLSESNVPAPYKRRYYLSCDGWDGFRDRRNALIKELAAFPNVVAITGDVHAFFAGTPAADDDPTKKIVEFVGSSISSTTFRSMLLSQVALDPVLSAAGAAAIVRSLEDRLRDAETKINPHLAFADARTNGFCIVEANADELVVSMVRIPEASLAEAHYEQPEAIEGVTISRFRTENGKSNLQMDVDGEWKTWDSAVLDWV
jgi:alkaline phosphatase D